MMAAISQGVDECNFFVFLVDGKIPGPDPAYSYGSDTAGLGPFPSSPER